VARGLRPTTLLLRVQPYSKWDELDFELMDALDLAEREINDQTGLPRWLTGTGSPEVDFLVETQEDGAQRALDEYDESAAGKDRKHGVNRYVVPESITGVPIEGGVARARFLAYAAGQMPELDETPLVDELGIETKKPVGGWNAAEYG
jgi:hypothetical protein